VKTNADCRNFLVVFEDCASDMGQIECVLKQMHCEPTPCPRKGCPSYTPAFFPGNYAGLIILGSSDGVNDKKEMSWIEEALHEDRTPVLAICHGAQLLAHVCNKKMNWKPLPSRHDGLCTVSMIGGWKEDSVFTVFDPGLPVPQSHGYYLTKPKGCISFVESIEGRSHCEAFRVMNTRSYGIQFHPEPHPASIRDWSEDSQEKPSPETCILIAEMGRRLIQAWVALALKRSDAP
jgi:GMP synthase-like glutamine amidotransferase